jgi:UDP-N-acetylmuramoylalanine--D-glutamate ligase
MNFAADHLDRYADIEAYREAKMRIFRNQTAEDTAVLNALEAPEVHGPRIVGFSSRPADRPGTYELVDGWIRYLGKPLVHYVAGHLRGRHNAENVMAAMAAAHSRGVPHESMVSTILDYRAPAHRCELVGTIEGREFLNDSKATNLHALASALRSLGQRVVLIAGGKDKGLDYAPLTPLIRNHTTAVVTIGEIGPGLHDLWQGVTVCRRADDLPQAVRTAFELSRPGQTILFSPGTSSFDMFRDYAHRGDTFREIVLQLSGDENVEESQPQPTP